MAHHSFAFNLPPWRPARYLHRRTGWLVFASGLWLLLYGWLGYRLWVGGWSRGSHLNGTLALLCVALGVAIALSWRALIMRWLKRVYHFFVDARHPALTVEELQRLTPSEFEEYVARRLFERQGYHADNLPDVKDGGIDVLVTDSHGRQAVVQCKRYRGTVGAAVLRDLYGTMVGAGAAHAFLVTAGPISRSARIWAEDKPITLIDGDLMVELARAEPKQHGEIERLRDWLSRVQSVVRSSNYQIT